MQHWGPTSLGVEGELETADMADIADAGNDDIGNRDRIVATGHVQCDHCESRMGNVKSESAS